MTRRGTELPRTRIRSGRASRCQLYLPADDKATHIGTIFHDRLPDGSLPKATQMRFARNTGYAFAVGDNTWHSADPVGNEVATRDSILLTYFVDAGLLRSAQSRETGRQPCAQ